MFMKLAVSFEPLYKSWVESRNFWFVAAETVGKKIDKHAQRFPFRVHYSAVPGEPELRGGVNSYQVRKNTLTETYPSSLWHRHLNPLVLKDVEGESSSLCISLHIWGVWMCAWCVRSKILHYDIFNLKPGQHFPLFWKIKWSFCGLILDIWEYIHNTNAGCCVFICSREGKLRFGGGSLLIYPRPIF